MKALIIEDEPFAQQELIRLIKKVDPSITVLKTLTSVEDSIKWLTDNPEPDLIFMDIQLSDGISFEIFREVDFQTPIVFTTAYDEYAIRAFDLNSIDYLLKPIDHDDLKKALTKFGKVQKAMARSPIFNDQLLDQLTGRNDYKSRFLIKKGDSIRHISVSEIAYFYSSSEITFIVTHERKKYAVDHTLDELSKLLDPSVYFRVSRKYIASISAIEEVRKHFNSRLKLMLNPPTDDEILVSRVRVSEFLKWLEK